MTMLYTLHLEMRIRFIEKIKICLSQSGGTEAVCIVSRILGHFETFLCGILT